MHQPATRRKDVLCGVNLRQPEHRVKHRISRHQNARIRNLAYPLPPCGKFRRRFDYLEKKVREDGRGFAGVSMEEMDSIWDEAKSKGL